MAKIKQEKKKNTAKIFSTDNSKQFFVRIYEIKWNIDLHPASHPSHTVFSKYVCHYIYICMYYIRFISLFYLMKIVYALLNCRNCDLIKRKYAT